MNRNVLLSDSIIQELYKDYTCPVATDAYNSPKLMKTEETMFDIEHKLRDTFTDEQKTIYDQWEAAYCDNHSLRESELFVYAFKLGARMMQEVMADPLRKDT